MAHDNKESPWIVIVDKEGFIVKIKMEEERRKYEKD